MSDTQPAASPSRSSLLWGTALMGILALMYVAPAMGLGSWQPWETTLAELGR